MRIIFIIVLFIPLQAGGQTEITGSVGYGFFAMKDMKSFQSYLQKELPINARITSAFPPFWYFEMSGLWWDESLVTGMAASYGSTGGRIYYSDYSGMVSIDQLLSSVSIDAIIGTKIGNKSDKLIILGQLRAGIELTTLQLKVDEVVGGQTQNEELKFNSLNGTIQPTFTITSKFNWIGIQALAGYQFTIVRGKLYYDEIDDTWLQSHDEQPLKADWSGFRTSLGITLYIF